MWDCGRGVERTRAWVTLKGATASVGGKALRAIGCREELKVRAVRRGGSALKESIPWKDLAGEKGEKLSTLYSQISLFSSFGVFRYVRWRDLTKRRAGATWRVEVKHKLKAILNSKTLNPEPKSQAKKHPAL